MVSVAGPYRKGKSYILSKAFDQPEVFPLGHEMVAETMGIWLWIVPEKFKVRNLRLFFMGLFLQLLFLVQVLASLSHSISAGFQEPGVHSGASRL